MSWLNKLSKEIKRATKVLIDNTVKEVHPEQQQLRFRILEKLDKNKDGKLTIDDIFELVREFFDINNNGKLDFWEIISALFEIRRLVKTIK